MKLLVFFAITLAWLGDALVRITETFGYSLLIRALLGIELGKFFNIPLIGSLFIERILGL